MILELAQIMANFVISAILLILVSGLVLSIGVLLWMYKVAKLGVE